MKRIILFFLLSLSLVDLYSQLHYNGSGIRLSREPKDGYCFVQSLVHNSPAARAGIKPGELICEVDGISAENKSSKDIVSMIRGENGMTSYLPSVRSTLNFIGNVSDGLLCWLCGTRRISLAVSWEISKCLLSGK